MRWRDKLVREKGRNMREKERKRGRNVWDGDKYFEKNTYQLCRLLLLDKTKRTDRSLIALNRQTEREHYTVITNMLYYFIGHKLWVLLLNPD